MKRVLLLGLVLIIPFILFAADVTPKGFLDSTFGTQIGKDEKIVTSKTRGRVGAEIVDDNSLLFLSLNAIYNPIIESENGLKLHEAYGEYISDYWDIRIGRQIIAWGKADGIRITDLLSPSDLTEFIAFEFDDIRIPVNSVKFRMLFEKVNFELIATPVFTPAKQAGQDSPWFIESSLPQNDAVVNINEPELVLKSGEIAGKVSFFLSKIDVAFSAMYLWDDFPVTTVGRDNTNNLVYDVNYYRNTILGAEAAIPAGDFVFRTEAAFYLKKQFQKEDMKNTSENQMIHWLAGADWYPGNNWSVTAQFSGKSILFYRDKISEEQNSWIATLNIQKKILRETLTIANMIYFEFNEPDGMDRFSIDYALTDPFHFLAGVDYMFGDSGYFGQFKNNSQIWIKAKYSF